MFVCVCAPVCLCLYVCVCMCLYVCVRVARAGYVFSWGTGYLGQLGLGDDSSWDSPRMIRSLDPAKIGEEGGREREGGTAAAGEEEEEERAPV
jgi:hypothetical protein